VINYALKWTPLCLCLAAATSALADHSDIVVKVEENQLAAYNQSSDLADCVFEGELGELSVPGYTDDPGFASDDLAGNSLLGYNVYDSLLFWDGEQYVPPPNEERLEIAIGGALQTTVAGDTGYQLGEYFAQADGGGQVHSHLDFFVKHPDWNPSNPYYNPITVGAYMLQLELTSSVHDASAPLAIVFSHGLGQEASQAAIDAARNMLCPECIGDFNGDSVVDLSDLAHLLGYYGTTSGASYEQGDLNGDGAVDLSDLAALLGYYGTVCE